MPIVGTSDMLRRARDGAYAIPGFCTWDAETVRVVLKVAEEER